jgi:hypothetical protein
VVVGEGDLETTRGKFTTVTSCHIYSIQRSTLKVGSECMKLLAVKYRIEGASGTVVARPTPMRKVRGSRPVRDKDFRVRMRRPNYLGLVTLTSFG